MEPRRLQGGDNESIGLIPSNRSMSLLKVRSTTTIDVVSWQDQGAYTHLVSQPFPGRKPKHEATLCVETVAVEIIPPIPCAEHGNTSKAVARISRDPSHGGVLGCIAYS